MKDEVLKRLKEARLAAGFRTATAAAESLDIPYQTYAGHENGSRDFDLEAAAKYARRFKVSLDWLVFGKGPDDKRLRAVVARLADPDLPPRVLDRVLIYAEGALDAHDQTKETATMPRS